MEDCILIEDECAPDAQEYFEKDLEKLTGLTINGFKEKATKEDDEYTLRYVYEEYVLWICADEQYWHLSRLKND